MDKFLEAAGCYQAKLAKQSTAPKSSLWVLWSLVDTHVCSLHGRHRLYYKHLVATSWMVVKSREVGVFHVNYWWRQRSKQSREDFRQPVRECIFFISDWWLLGCHWTISRPIQGFSSWFRVTDINFRNTRQLVGEYTFFPLGAGNLQHQKSVKIGILAPPTKENGEIKSCTCVGRGCHISFFCFFFKACTSNSWGTKGLRGCRPLT